MSRRFINQLGEHETIDEVYMIWDKQLRTNRNGNLYLQLRLADRTGSIIGMMWNANDRLYASFDNGDYLHVQGSTQFYGGNLQLIVNRIEPAVKEKVDETDFVTLAEGQIDEMAGRLAKLLRGMRNYHLRNLSECFLMDEQFMTQFVTAPAGIKHHHAYKGGLLEHVVNLMELTQSVAKHYPAMDAELLLVGAFLHDIGKTEELLYDREMTYSDAGQLIGHVVLALGMIDSKITDAARLSGEPFPEELALQLKHMVLSHHGEYAYGSPKLPMTLEAITLHFLDNLDSKLHSVQQLMREDANADSNWTTFQPSMGRKFYKSINDS
jgi:3'-5' exoribonuclease